MAGAGEAFFLRCGWPGMPGENDETLKTHKTYCILFDFLVFGFMTLNMFSYVFLNPAEIMHLLHRASSLAVDVRCLKFLKVNCFNHHVW